MKKQSLIKKLQKLNIELNNNSFEYKSKTVDVKFQDGEVLFYSYDNYNSPIIFYSFNDVVRHWA